MMSQNRTSELDRLSARADHLINQKAETEVEEILTLLRAQTVLLERFEVQLPASSEARGWTASGTNDRAVMPSCRRQPDDRVDAAAVGGQQLGLPAAALDQLPNDGQPES